MTWAATSGRGANKSPEARERSGRKAGSRTAATGIRRTARSDLETPESPRRRSATSARARTKTPSTDRRRSGGIGDSVLVFDRASRFLRPATNLTRRKNSSDLIKPGAIVGTVHSPESLRAARRIRRGVLDGLELRVDHFAESPGPLLAAAPALDLPLIVTVRHPAEGGKSALDFAQRRNLYAQFLPFAAAIDVELRSVLALA